MASMSKVELISWLMLASTPASDASLLVRCSLSSSASIARCSSVCSLIVPLEGYRDCQGFEATSGSRSTDTAVACCAVSVCLALFPCISAPHLRSL